MYSQEAGGLRYQVAVKAIPSTGGSSDEFADARAHDHRQQPRAVDGAVDDCSAERYCVLEAKTCVGSSAAPDALGQGPRFNAMLRNAPRRCACRGGRASSGTRSRTASLSDEAIKMHVAAHHNTFVELGAVRGREATRRSGPTSRGGRCGCRRRPGTGPGSSAARRSGGRRRSRMVDCTPLLIIRLTWFSASISATPKAAPCRRGSAGSTGRDDGSGRKRRRSTRTRRCRNVRPAGSGTHGARCRAPGPPGWAEYRAPSSGDQGPAAASRYGEPSSGAVQAASAPDAGSLGSRPPTGHPPCPQGRPSTRTSSPYSPRSPERVGTGAPGGPRDGVGQSSVATSSIEKRVTR